MGAPWYEELFDERYLDFYPVLRSEPVSAHEARQVMELLGLQPGQTLLDLGCGTGRHSVALAAEGLEVTGLDLSSALLARARATADERGVKVTWLERDMRDLDDVGPFDAAASLYTAFGFLGAAEDREALNQAAAALRPGGRLLLDLTNFAGYLADLPREVLHETTEALMRERNSYDPLRGVLITRRTRYLKSGGEDELPPSEVRAYQPHELLAMLGCADLQVEHLMGSLEGEAYVWDSSPNQVYLCRKPE